MPDDEHTDTRPESVVHPASRLAGPEGHPYHPLLVTLPIGAWVSSFGFDIASHIAHDVTFARGAMWLIFIGAGGAVLAAIFGLLDLRTIPAETPAKAIAYGHLVLNATATFVFVVDGLLRHNAWRPPFTSPWWAMVMSGFALLCVAASGYLGGRLAYHFGVRVAGTAMQAEGFVHTDEKVVI